jgi:hypothetical protein
MRTFLLASLMLGACSPVPPVQRVAEKSPPASPVAAQAKPLVTTFTLRDQTFTLGTDHPYPACEQPELWLTFFRPQEFRAAYCTRCGASTWCSSDTGDESGGPWSFASERSNLNGFWCNELRYLRHAIGAELGVAAPPGRFARHFGYQRWYSPQPAMTEADLPSAAQENLAWLGEQLDQCDANGGKVTAEDQRLVDDWFDASYAGQATLPKRLFDNCNPVSAEEFGRILRSEAYLRYSARTPVVRYDHAGCPGWSAPRWGRVLHVHVGAWLTGEPCTECEGHQILQIFVDQRRRIVALGAVMSG